jgi:diguanylate cyclase (GGDEF)-like protein/PAS domain S-box-containing protein
VLLALGLVAGVVLVDLVAADVVLIGLLTVGPLIASMRLGAAGTAVVAALALLGALLLGIPNGIFLESDHLGRMIVVLVGGVVASTIADLRERSEATAARLTEAAARRAAVLDTALDGIITMDRHGRVLEFNPAAERIFGYGREEAVGRELAELVVPPSLRQRHRDGLARYLATGRSPILDQRMELPAMRSDGSQFPAELAVTRVEEGGAEMFVGFVRDITERNRLEQQLAHQALHDALTGLPNRTLFMDRVELALRRSSRSGAPVTLMVLDLDDFKAINDRLGHRAGDQALAAVGARLRGLSRPGDTVARFGGDEFAVLCEGVESDEQALAIARRLVAGVTGPLGTGGHDVGLALSVGIAVARGGDATAESLLSEADAAMYHAKRRGGGEAQLFAETMRWDPSRHTFEQELRTAVKRRQLTVLYQPQVELGSGRVVGAEALVRWNHPERGLLGPAEFIGAAEEAGLIGALGAGVLQEACHQASRWRAGEDGSRLVVSVNCSASQFVEPGFIELVAGALAAAGIGPEALCLEITESTLMRHTPALETLGRLGEMGVEVAIDDFGTGYSSLDYLRRFPVNRLKIDRSFVAGVAAPDPRSDDAALVAAMTDMGHALGLTVVAEGVETERQATRLLELGCDHGQGFHFARPAPPQALDELLEDARLVPG